MRLTIFGSGYVGHVTGACLAEMDNHVLCYDIDEDKIDRLNNGDIFGLAYYAIGRGRG